MARNVDQPPSKRTQVTRAPAKDLLNRRKGPFGAADDVLSESKCGSNSYRTSRVLGIHPSGKRFGCVFCGSTSTKKEPTGGRTGEIHKKRESKPFSRHYPLIPYSH